MSCPGVYGKILSFFLSTGPHPFSVFPYLDYTFDRSRDSAGLWRIGTKTNVSVRRDKWLLRAHSTSHATPLAMFADVLVLDLIDSSTFTWKVETVQALLISDDADLV